MSIDLDQAHRQQAEAGDRPGLVWLMAIACDVTIANIYYAQPLTGLIGRDLGLPSSRAVCSSQCHCSDMAQAYC
jgi:hypothetical protein